jgi:hypothetical protein
VIWLNLTNGIEALPLPMGEEIRFVRIQSTACEQKRWSQIIEDLDYNFLMHLAQGEHCVVVDFSVRRRMTRAVWQGVAWLNYALNRRWFDLEITVWTRRHNATSYFREQYNVLTFAAKKRLDYVKKFLNCTSVNIVGCGDSTRHDSDYKFFRSFLKEHWRSPDD